MTTKNPNFKHLDFSHKNDPVIKMKDQLLKRVEVAQQASLRLIASMDVLTKNTQPTKTKKVQIGDHAVIVSVLGDKSVRVDFATSDGVDQLYDSIGTIIP